jgi:hypothetical protein
MHRIRVHLTMRYPALHKILTSRLALIISPEISTNVTPSFEIRRWFFLWRLGRRCWCGRIERRRYYNGLRCRSRSRCCDGRRILSMGMRYKRSREHIRRRVHRFDLSGCCACITTVCAGFLAILMPSVAPTIIAVMTEAIAKTTRDVILLAFFVMKERLKGRDSMSPGKWGWFGSR